MTENQTVTVAEKRQWLKDNGYDVASRGKLSAEHEQAYLTGAPAGSAQAETQSPGDPEA